MSFCTVPVLNVLCTVSVLTVFCTVPLRREASCALAPTILVQCLKLYELAHYVFFAQLHRLLG